MSYVLHNHNYNYNFKSNIEHLKCVISNEYRCPYNKKCLENG